MRYQHSASDKVTMTNLNINLNEKKKALPFLDENQMSTV
jgi:hypothetical protein